ncbi:PRC-barrel domain-containing protein [Falsiroseomonas tokyonensis]|uniref:PRC-barrel domain-containing protein n=1 Tax=Falsiroseomonas tokyonensis TaxID=430521 RepID=A0ABV7BRB5_9PROT|nr:PRC-barrel domain-containing protein [Falsiroseomonas tokyonensis]MBU8536603.1 PRC-barrel domain-containing protein [Falsiroseomonas tokyonensis]
MTSGRFIAAALVALLAGAAAPLPAAAVELEYGQAEAGRMVPDLGLRAGQIAGAMLYTDTGDAIGEIEAVLVTQDGLLAGLGVEVGGFLGIGDRDVLLRFSQVHRVGDRIVTLLSRAQLEAQPEWDD